MKRIMENYGHQGVPPELVEAAKKRRGRERRVWAQFHFQSGSPGRRLSPPKAASRPMKIVEAIKQVTVADVNRVAKEISAWPLQSSVP